jgi:hypothetical protein
VPGRLSESVVKPAVSGDAASVFAEGAGGDSGWITEVQTQAEERTTQDGTQTHDQYQEQHLLLILYPFALPSPPQCHQNISRDSDRLHQGWIGVHERERRKRGACELRKGWFGGFGSFTFLIIRNLIIKFLHLQVPTAVQSGRFYHQLQMDESFRSTELLAGRVFALHYYDSTCSLRKAPAGAKVVWPRSQEWK